MFLVIFLALIGTLLNQFVSLWISWTLKMELAILRLNRRKITVDFLIDFSCWLVLVVVQTVRPVRRKLRGICSLRHWTWTKIVQSVRRFGLKLNKLRSVLPKFSRRRGIQNFPRFLLKFRWSDCLKFQLHETRGYGRQSITEDRCLFCSAIFTGISICGSTTIGPSFWWDVWRSSTHHLKSEPARSSLWSNTGYRIIFELALIN